MRNWSRFILVLGLLLMAVVPALAQDADASHAAVTLVTPNYPIALESTFDVVIQVNTGGSPVDAAAAYLNFDPAVFQVVRVQPGTALPIFLQSITDNTAGHVDFAAGQFPPTYPTGSFTLATVTLRAISTVDAGLLTLSFDRLRQTDVVAAGESVLANAVGSVVMVSRDAAPAPENVTAPRSSAELPVQLGALPVAPLPQVALPDAEVLLSPVAPPFSTSMDSADAWASAGGWSLQAGAGVDGSGWTASGATGESSLRLTQPIDLNGLVGAQVSFSYRMSGTASQGRLEARTASSDQWSPVAFMVASDSWTPLTVDLTGFVGQVVQLRFVWQAPDGASADVLALDNLSVAGQTAQPEVIVPQELPGN